MQNGTQIVSEMYSRNFENWLFNLCVGKNLGGKPREVSRSWQKIRWWIYNILVGISWARHDAGGRGGEKTTQE